MKKIFALFLIAIITLASVAMAAKKTVRIARLPILVQQNTLDYETSVTLETKLARAVKFPVNEEIQIVEYVPPKKASEKLNKIWQKMYAKNKNSNIDNAIKRLADNLKADLVILPILHQYYQSETDSDDNSGKFLSSKVSAEMIIYDKTTGNFIKKEAERDFNDSYNKFGTAAHLAGECFDQLIQDTQLIHIIRTRRG